jgi:hypothetical protein
MLVTFVIEKLKYYIRVPSVNPLASIKLSLHVASAGLLQRAFQQRNHLVVGSGLTRCERCSPRRDAARNHLELLMADSDVTKSSGQPQLGN